MFTLQQQFSIMPCTLCGTRGHNRRTCQAWWRLLPRILDESLSNIATEPLPMVPPMPEYIARTPDNNFNYITSVTSVITNNEVVNLIENDNDNQDTNHTPSRILFPDIPNDLWSDDDDNINPNIPIVEYNIDRKPTHSKPLVECVKEPCITTECPICMETLQNVDIMVTRCGHKFHSTCMIIHMRAHDNCPMCRGTLFSS